MKLRKYIFIGIVIVGTFIAYYFSSNDKPLPAEKQIESVLDTITITPTQFQNSSLTESVMWYLEKRGKDNPATLEEIINALDRGGFPSTERTGMRIMSMKDKWHLTSYDSNGVKKFGI